MLFFLNITEHNRTAVLLQTLSQVSSERNDISAKLLQLLSVALKKKIIKSKKDGILRLAVPLEASH